MGTVLDLAGSRRGHFVMESGYHSSLWFDLEVLFDDGSQVDPFVDRLAAQLSGFDLDVVCGPASGGAKLAERIAARLGCGFAFTEPGSTDARGLFTARYILPPQFADSLRGKRVALVDDVMSAGSSLRATMTEVEAAGGRTVVIGALHVLGGAGVDFFLQRGLSVEMVGRGDYEMWRPERCPLCAAGAPLDDVGAVKQRSMSTAIHRHVEAARSGTLERMVARMPCGWAVLGDPQITRGYCLLLPDPVVPHLNALSGDRRRQFLDDMARLGDAVLAVTAAERINYEILGNVEPALHAHVIPRHASEDAELRTKPVWLHDWSAAPPVDAAAILLARRIAALL
ncbi:MAG: phosphoribosyltransferase family protein [Vicinamibacterales bacterium]